MLSEKQKQEITLALLASTKVALFSIKDSPNGPTCGFCGNMSLADILHITCLHAIDECQAANQDIHQFGIFLLESMREAYSDTLKQIKTSHSKEI